MKIFSGQFVSSSSLFRGFEEPEMLSFSANTDTSLPSLRVPTNTLESTCISLRFCGIKLVCRCIRSANIALPVVQTISITVVNLTLWKPHKKSVECEGFCSPIANTFRCSRVGRGVVWTLSRIPAPRPDPFNILGINNCKQSTSEGKISNRWTDYTNSDPSWLIGFISTLMHVNSGRHGFSIA